MSVENVKISKIFNVSRGGSPRPIQNYITEGDGVNWVMIGDTVENERYISQTKKKIKAEGVKNSRKVFPGDFLLTNSMSFGRPYILNVEGCIHDGWLVLSPISDNIDKVFMYYCLSSGIIKKQINSKAAGAVVKNLNSEIVRDIEIPLPPLSTQKAIAEKLDKADALRKKDQDLLAQYDELAQAIFIDMFGDPMKNEKGWEIKTLSEVCNKITDGTHHSPPVVDQGFPYVTAKHVKKDGLDFFAKPTFIDKIHHDEIYKRCKAEFGDVLYIKDGATTGIACINSFVEPISLLSSLALFKLNPSIINNYYLVNWLNSEDIKSVYITNNMAGAAIKRFTLSKLKEFKVLIPPLKLQTQFAEKIKNIEEQKALMKQQAQQSEYLFQALLQESFNF